jgi:hypothetical protein
VEPAGALELSSYSVRYKFSQRFALPAETAYKWCTDYAPDDPARMGENGTRKVKHVNDDTLILTDTVVDETGPVTKQRLVRLHPERLAWTSTHLTGSNKYSQFWYQIVSESTNKSRLDFTGLHVNYGRRPEPARLKQIERELVAADSHGWVLLEKEMRKDLRN